MLGEPICSKVQVPQMLCPVGLIVNRLAGGNAKTGTSNDSNTACKFFLMKNRDIIADCVMEKPKEIVRQLHKKISILLRVVSSCSKKVYIQKLAQLTTKTSLLIAKELKWVDSSWTLHGLLHHSLQLVHLNGGWALGFLSEEVLESNNKFVRQYLEQYATIK